MGPRLADSAVFESLGDVSAIDRADERRYHRTPFVPVRQLREEVPTLDDLLADLNTAQRDAVTHRGSPLLVVAGAGSGKTRVITRRIAHLIRSGLRSAEILAITFTNKAAAEMKDRVSRTIGESRTWISTFHALGARILRMEAEAAGLDPNFSIFDESDQTAVMREVLKELGLTGRDHSAKDYLSIVSHLKNRGVSADDIHDPILREHLKVFEGYERGLIANRAVDFDDLLVRSVRLLRDHPDVRARIAGRFRAVLVDEYQDTNRLQYEMTRLLFPESHDLCATGDPDQSIYSWRGADVRNILEFETDFPGTRVIKLEENYRSTNRILRAASAVIRNNRHRIDRELWSNLGDGEPIRLRVAATERDEGRSVADAIRSLSSDGVSLDDCAVLYRTNACSRVLEQSMRDANLPYVIVGAVEFYERREVKDLIAYLRLVSNPADEVAFTRIVNVPARGVGAKSLESLRASARADGVPLADVACDRRVISTLRTKDAREALLDFTNLIRELRSMPRSPTLAILDHVIAAVGYRKYLSDLPDLQSDDRLENVDELRRALREYDAANPRGSLEQFLNETALVRSRDELADGEPRVTLMTLHSAKGLEFPYVFLVALEEGLLPHSRSLSDESAIEEERRLFYVGITRAQKRLTLSYARSRAAIGSGGSFAIASRFLHELPPESVEGALRPRRELSFLEEEPSFEPAYESDEPPFVQGDRVLHERFGVGSVLSISGFGPSARVTVDFDEYGPRKLILEFARLKKAIHG